MDRQLFEVVNLCEETQSYQAYCQVQAGQIGGWVLLQRLSLDGLLPFCCCTNYNRCELLPLEYRKKKCQMTAVVSFIHLIKMSQPLIKHISTNFLNFGAKYCQSHYLFLLVSKNSSKIFLKLIKTNNGIGEIWHQNSKSLCLCA